ncbi:MAG: hypothetical protein ACP5I7_00685 [Sulfolobales archaeon]
MNKEDLYTEALQLLKLIKEKFGEDTKFTINDLRTQINKDSLRIRILLAMLIEKGYIEEIVENVDLDATNNMCSLCMKCPFRKFCPINKISREIIVNLRSNKIIFYRLRRKVIIPDHS